MNTSVPKKQGVDVVKWITLIIAIIAVGASFYSVGVTSDQFLVTKNLSERDRFRDLLIKMAEARDKNRKASPCAQPSIYRYQKTPENELEVSFGYKVNYCTNFINESIIQAPKSFSTEIAIVYFQEARDIEPSIEHLVTTTEYLLLADMAFAHSGVDSANKYAIKAYRCAEKNGDATSMVSVLQALGDLQFSNYPQASIDDGRKYYREAVEKLDSLPRVKKSPFAEAGLWANWAIAEAKVGELERAYNNLDEAEKQLEHTAYSTESKHAWKLKVRTQVAEAAIKSQKIKGEWVTIGQYSKFKEAPQLEWSMFPKHTEVPQPRKTSDVPKTFVDPPKTFAPETNNSGNITPVQGSGFGTKK